MPHRFFTFFIFTFFCANVYSQKDSDSSLLSRYSTNLSIKDAPYVIIKLSENSSEESLQEIQRIALRQLSRDMFVIRNESVSSDNFKKYILKTSAANDSWKLSPKLEKLRSFENNKLHRFIFQCSDEINAKRLLTVISSSGIAKTYQSNNIVSFINSFDFILKNILNDPSITGIDIVAKAPKEELGITGFDLSTNQLNLVHSRYPSIKGEGQHVSVKENFYDTADIDLRGRMDPSPLGSSSVTNHANYMATIIAGAGNSVYYAKGAAPAARISSSSFEAVLPDPDNYYLENNITVQNHSYGTEIDNSYGLNAVAFDNNANKNEDLLHVFSSGNSGAETSNEGTYKGIAGFGNITGNFKMAKNVLLVGASDSTGNAVAQSSAGPGYDGRILPHLVAFQMNGTSESAALVSGTSLLLQQFYLEKNKSVCPSTLVKAILINSADDVGTPGPDFKTGFGNMNALNAMNYINENKIFSGEIRQGKTDSFQVTIPANCRLFKITLAWNDTTASEFSAKALMNDIDLRLELTAENKSWDPWVLSSVPDADSLSKPAERKRDDLNNQEQISIMNPSPGVYTIKVNGFSLVSEKQKYFIAYDTDTTNFFQWELPASENFIEQRKPSTLKWQTSFTGKGTIEYKFTGNGNWVTLADADLINNRFIWSAPDTLATTLLRMKIENQIFYSDSFLITQLLQPSTALVCGDSIQIFWSPVKGASSYEIYRLGDKYMEPFKEVTQTFAAILKNETSNHFFAVAPVFQDNSIGQKSYAFDYTLQGAGCFINSFYVNPNGNNAVLFLNLGTLNNVANIEFQKINGNNSETINRSLVDGLAYTFTYSPLQTGISFFRAKITLKTGAVIYSNIESVTYVEQGKYLLLPVPVKKNLPVNLYTSIPDGEIITITDVMGRCVLRKEIQFVHEYIETSALQAGQYFYRIVKDGKTVASGKLLVL